MEEKNYYEWLEISRNASPEVIEKAYKALVKKYHPDLQEGDAKAESEEILKHITEAYSVLSDAIKKAEYDANLQDDSVSKEDYDKLKQELNNMRYNNAQEAQASNNTQNNQGYEQPNYTYQNNQTEYQEPSNNAFDAEQEALRRQQEELQYQQQVEYARQKAYHDAYIQDLKNRGYKIRYKKSFKDYVRIAITIVAVIVVLIILWHIPPIHNWLVTSYNENPIIKFVVDAVLKLVDTLVGLFK